MKKFYQISYCIITSIILFSTFFKIFAASMGGVGFDYSQPTEVWENDDNYDEFGNLLPQFQEWDFRDVEQDEEETTPAALPDQTIDYHKPNLNNAKYYVNDNSVTITCDGTTYYVYGKDAAGFYTKVDVDGKTYSLERYGKIAGQDYWYKGKEYWVDEQGFMCAYRVEWVQEKINGKVSRGYYDDTKLLWRYEVPFNILWANKPLTEAEKELLHTGPGVNIKSFSTGNNSDGTVNVIINRNQNKNTRDNAAKNALSKTTIDDPLDPMKAKSTKKKNK